MRWKCFGMPHPDVFLIRLVAIENAAVFVNKSAWQFSALEGVEEKNTEEKVLCCNRNVQW